MALVQRQAAAADAGGQAFAQPLELGDAFVDTTRPSDGDPRPVRSVRRAIGRQLRELAGNLFQRQANLLSEHDEGNPPQDRAGIASMPRAGTLGADQPSIFVKPQSGRGHPAAVRDVGDGQQVGHGILS
jgi:hypothetical protein